MTDSWIARRTASFDSSGIRKVFDLAAQLKDPINLSIGQPDYDVPEAVRTACVDAIQSGKNGYALTQGMPVLREKLQAVVDEDICMEVNTSGLTKGDFEVHPEPLILDSASEMGVKLTIGSDSHRPNSVGQFFDTIQPLLREKGFKDLHYFRARKRIRIDMPKWD